MIILSVNDFNEILKLGKQFADVRHVNDRCKYIQLRIKDRVLIASAFDGSKIGSITMPCDSDDETIFMPVLKPFGKNEVLCKISQDANEITIKTGAESRCFPRVEVEPYEPEKFMPNTGMLENTFYFNPQNLADALSVFAGEKSVKIDYYGEMLGVVISNGIKNALVLPTRPPKK